MANFVLWHLFSRPVFFNLFLAELLKGYLSVWRQILKKIGENFIEMQLAFLVPNCSETRIKTFFQDSQLIIFCLIWVNLSYSKDQKVSPQPILNLPLPVGWETLLYTKNFDEINLNYLHRGCQHIFKYLNVK